MSRNSKINKINCLYRIIDANANRAKEGLRVCEEVTRFVLNLKSLTKEIKNTRHRLQVAISRLCQNNLNLIDQRNASNDVGKDLACQEYKRRNFKDIFFANAQRAKESLRVLEEFSKLIDLNSAKKFKRIRYKTYEIEKKVAQKL